ncbi:Beta-ketoacyl synthase, partial [Macrophomina phaseolina MS6]
MFSTAHYCLAEVARLSAGETCLIHAAAGGLGQAAIQIAQNIGAEVFATVSSPEQRQLLMDEYGILAEHIFSSRDLSFAVGVMRMTNGRGVDVVLNSLAGEALRASWNCIATLGRFIEIGKRDVFANGRLGMLPFCRSVTFAACDLYAIIELDTKTTHRTLNEIIRMWQSGAIKAAKPNSVCLSPRSRGIPLAASRSAHGADATYILSGGLGDLDRSIARWAARQGDRNLVFLSRSGSAGDAAQELLQELQSSGVRAAALVCNVSDEDALIKALKECEKDGFPKVAGVIQGAMQLE